MKKVFFMLVAIFLFSCENKIDDIVSDPLRADSRLMRDGKCDAVGQGYYVLGEFASPEYVRAPILDQAKLWKEKIVTREAIGGTNYQDYVGETFQECTNKFTSNAKFGIPGIGIFSASFTQNVSKEEYSSKNVSVGLRHILVKTKVIRINLPVEQLDAYLVPSAKVAINDPLISPASLFRTYGTHLLTNVTLGGRMDFKYSAVIEKANKTETVKLGLETKFGKYFEANYDQEKETKVNGSVSNENIVLSSVGGNTDIIPSKKLDYDSNNLSSNLDSWKKSINDDNSSIIDFQDLIPIWRFASTEARRNELMKAYDELAKANGVISNIDYLPEPYIDFNVRFKYLLNKNVDNGKFSWSFFTAYALKKEGDKNAIDFVSGRGGGYYVINNPYTEELFTTYPIEGTYGKANLGQYLNFQEYAKNGQTYDNVNKGSFVTKVYSRRLAKENHFIYIRPYINTENRNFSTFMALEWNSKDQKVYFGGVILTQQPNVDRNVINDSFSSPQYANSINWTHEQRKQISAKVGDNLDFIFNMNAALYIPATHPRERSYWTDNRNINLHIDVSVTKSHY